MVVDRVQLSKRLNELAPLNEFGLPIGFYRPDCIDWHQLDEFLISLDHDRASSSSSTPTQVVKPTKEDAELSTITNEPNEPSEPNPIEVQRTTFLAERTHKIAQYRKMLAAAYVPLDYSEGFPALPSGFPFWTMLDFEPVQLFGLFDKYIKMGKAGPRQLYLLVAGEETEYDLGTLQELYHTFNWQARAKAYDLFHQAAKMRQREAAIWEMEDEHLKTANKLSKMAMDYLEDPENQALLTPLAAIKILELSSKMHRLSLGLPAAGPLPAAQAKGGAPTGVSLEVLLRHIATQNQQAGGGTTLDNNGNPDATIDSDRFQLEILKDPNLTQLAQELILSVGKPGEKTQTRIRVVHDPVPSNS